MTLLPSIALCVHFFNSSFLLQGRMPLDIVSKALVAMRASTFRLDSVIEGTVRLAEDIFLPCEHYRCTLSIIGISLVSLLPT